MKVAASFMQSQQKSFLLGAVFWLCFLPLGMGPFCLFLGFFFICLGFGVLLKGRKLWSGDFLCFVFQMQNCPLKLQAQTETYEDYWPFASVSQAPTVLRHQPAVSFNKPRTRSNLRLWFSRYLTQEDLPWPYQNSSLSLTFYTIE